MKKHFRLLNVVVIVLAILFMLYAVFNSDITAFVLTLSVVAVLLYITILMSAGVIYSITPKFWDKVYYEKEAHSADNNNTSDTDNRESASSINHLLLCMLPNIRKLAKVWEKEHDIKEYSINLALVVFLLFVILYISYSGLFMEFIIWLKQFGV